MDGMEDTLQSMLSEIIALRQEVAGLADALWAITDPDRGVTIRRAAAPTAAKTKKGAAK